MLHVSLPPETEALLRERAQSYGEDVASYAARLLKEALTAPSVEEHLAPFRQQVKNSLMSDAELDSFYEGLRDKLWQESQANKAKTE